MTRHQPIPAAAELHANVAVPFAQLHAAEIGLYQPPDFLDLEQRHVFAKDWICAGRAETLPEPGDYLTLTIAGEPVIVLRDREGGIRALSNVCRHRMSTPCRDARFGALHRLPLSRLDLQSSTAPCAEPPPWGRTRISARRSSACPPSARKSGRGWIMVTLNPEALLPSVALKGIADLIPYLDMSTYTETYRESFNWATNWKVLAENFMESYSSADVPCRHHRRGLEPQRDDLPGGDGGLQLPLDPEERSLPPRPCPSFEHHA